MKDLGNVFERDVYIGFLLGDIDSRSDEQLRSKILAPLTQLAAETGVAVVCIKHLNGIFYVINKASVNPNVSHAKIKIYLNTN